MEYDKRNYQKANDRKVLHKIRKHWVVVSTALLMAIGGGAVATTHASANADATNGNNNTNSSTSSVKEQMNQKLQMPSQQNNNSVNNASTTANNNGANANNNAGQKSITNQAAALHNNLMQHAAANAGQQQNNSSAQSAQQNNANANNNVAAGQGRVNTPNVNNNGAKVGATRVTSDTLTNMEKRASQNGVQAANHVNNQVDVNRQNNGVNNTPTHTLLGGSYYGGNFGNYRDTPTSKTNDSDGMFTVGANLQYDANNDSFYQPGYSDQFDPSDNGSDYGEITVQYVDPSDSNRLLGDETVDGPAKDGTPFGNSTDPTKNDVQSYAQNIPQGGSDPYGYSLVKNGTQISDGHGHNKIVNSIDSGSQISAYKAGENQFLVINVHRNQAPTQPGKVLVQYEDASNGDEIVGSHVDSDEAGKPFDQQGYQKNVPQGYAYESYTTSVGNGTPNAKDTDPITNFGNGNIQQLTIYVHPSSHETTATINYVDNANGATVGTRTIQGVYDENSKSNLDYHTLNQFVPSGYTFAKDGLNNPTQFLKNGKAVATIYVQKSKNSANSTKPVKYGTITIHYQNSQTHSDITTLTLSHPDKTPFSMDNIDGNNTKADSLLPDGWVNPTDNSNDVTAYDQSNPQDVFVTVSQDPNYHKHEVVGDVIQYMSVDPNNPTAAPQPLHGPASRQIQLFGYPGTKIPYSQYTQFVPQGYKFYGYGAHNPVMESNQVNVILVESNNSLAQPLTVHYINQDGSDVDQYSTPVKNMSDTTKQNDNVPQSDYSKTTPVDEIPLNGTFNQNYKASDIANKRPMPNGYTLAASQKGQQYHIGSDAQTVNLLVDGNPVNSQKNDPNYNLHVTQRIVDTKGNLISTNTVTDPIMGNTGDVFTINPNDYLPAPTSDFTAKNDSDQKIKINDSVQTVNGQKTGLVYANNQVIPTVNGTNNDITFTYQENNATGNVFYEDTSDGNNVVGSTTINDLPNTPLSKYESNLDHIVPYGYKFASNSSNFTNPGKLANGANYIVYVDSAHLQPKPTITPRPNYGYITVNYGSNFGTSKQVIYSTTTTTGADNTPFTGNNYITPTNQGGQMPDVYTAANPATTPSDALVTTYSASKPGTYNVEVTRNNSNPSTSSMVSDMITYKVLNSDGTSDTKVSLNPLMIRGHDGATINYVPYTNNVPQGYYYDGTATYSSIYTNGQDTASNPVASIYLKKAANASNGYPNYYPSDEPNNGDVNHGSTPVTPGVNPKTGQPNNPASSDTGYYPGSDAPVTTTNPNNDPNPSGYTPSDPNKPSDGGSINNTKNNPGYVPAGYVPGWVPNKKSGKYQPGYVPSDNIPSGYVPGEVPNGKGGYVPGYVPGDSKDWPSGTNGTNPKTGKPNQMPKYVPGNVPNGKTTTITVPDGRGGTDTKVIHETVPGVVPNVPPYATGSNSQITVQYVNAYNHADVISNAEAGGNVGGDFNLNKSNQFMVNLPSGYTDPSVLGGQSDFHFTDAPQTVQVALKQMASGNVVYEDADNNNTQVGSTSISGAAGDPVNFNTTPDNKYTQLLPYNYENASVATGNPTTLQNGADYVIMVHEAHKRPAATPQPQSGYGEITINYVTGNGNNQTIVGTDSFSQPNGNQVGLGNALSQNVNSDGYVPYGFTNANATDVATANAAYYGGRQNRQGNYTQPQQTFTIHVDPDSSTYNKPAPTLTDKIAYSVVTPTGDHMIMYGRGSKAGQLVTSDDPDASVNPLTFNVSGKAGSAINYAPYETDVPSGYQYDGLGNHGNAIDGAHNGTNNTYDTVLLRPAKQAATIGTITVNYQDTQGHNIDSVNLTGISGTEFDQSYYENDLPVAQSGETPYQFKSADNDLTQYSTNPQTVNITVEHAPKAKTQYGHIEIDFVKADDPNVKSAAANGTALTASQLSNAQVGNPEVMSGHAGDIFSPEEYEHNTPENTTFDHIAQGKDIGTFLAGQTQHVYIAVNTTNGAF